MKAKLQTQNKLKSFFLHLKELCLPFDNKIGAYGIYDHTATNKVVLSKTTLTNLLYIFAIVSIGFWILSLKVFSVEDAYQFAIGVTILLINIILFKASKI